MEKKIGIIGFGNMGYAIAKAMLDSNKIKAENITVSDKTKKKWEKIKQEYNVNYSSENRELAEKSDIILVCVKPQDIGFLEELKEVLKSKLIISIAAGVKIEKIAWLSGSSRIIRVMPNTGCLVGESASAYAVSSDVSEEDESSAKKIFSSGVIVKVDEAKMNAVTALSGSGPAFIAYLLKGLKDAAVKNNLGENEASRLIIQTCIGTGKLLEKYSFDELIKMVSSPGGTTEKGIQTFESSEQQKILEDVIGSAIKRGEELGNKK